MLNRKSSDETDPDFNYHKVVMESLLEAPEKDESELVVEPEQMDLAEPESRLVLMNADHQNYSSGRRLLEVDDGDVNQNRSADMLYPV